MTLTDIIQLSTSLVGTLCFGILFNIRGLKLIFSAIGGLLSWGLFLLHGENFFPEVLFLCMEKMFCPVDCFSCIEKFTISSDTFLCKKTTFAVCNKKRPLSVILILFHIISFSVVFIFISV